MPNDNAAVAPGEDSKARMEQPGVLNASNTPVSPALAGPALTAPMPISLPPTEKPALAPEASFTELTGSLNVSGSSVLSALASSALSDAPPSFSLKASHSALLQAAPVPLVPSFSLSSTKSSLLTGGFKGVETAGLVSPKPQRVGSTPTERAVPTTAVGSVTGVEAPAAGSFATTSYKPKVDAKLLSGQELRFKKRTRREIDMTHSNYGVNIDALYQRIELRQLEETAAAKRQRKAADTVLWAEKWRPTSFFDLVGNEKTNRYILQWIRQWSQAVFGETTEKDPGDDPNLDPYQRPRKKILLIHGPPGIGKTTVAHVLSKQMGYDIMEINASDERSGARIRDKVHNTLTSRTFSGRPNILVADEVDGAAENGFIRVLTDLLYHDSRAVASYQRGTKDKQRRFLMRPIITICNDLYAPALERLKPHCEILTFRRPDDKLVRDRLTEVLRLENRLASFDKRQIADVVAVNHADIRSCLNYLQFSSGDSLVQAHTKDSQVTWFAIVNRLFMKNNRKLSDQFSEVSRLVDNHTGNHDKLISGCFALFPQVYYHDEGMQKPAAISDWLHFNDLLDHNGAVAEGFDHFSYSSAVLLKFWHLFSDLGNLNNSQRIPNVDYEHFQAFQRNYNLIGNCFTSAFPVGLRVLLQRQHMALEVLPMLSKILLPEFQKQTSANRSIMMAHGGNKQKAEHAAAVARSLHMEVLNKRNVETATFTLEFEPNFESVVVFDEKHQAARKAVVLPVLLEELQRGQTKRRVGDTAEAVVAEKRPKHASSVDFFKNRYDELNNTLSNAPTEGTRKRASAQHRIWVKYHEGFSNAVRKNIAWADLWV